MPIELAPLMVMDPAFKIVLLKPPKALDMPTELVPVSVMLPLLVNVTELRLLGVSIPLLNVPLSVMEPPAALVAAQPALSQNIAVAATEETELMLPLLIKVAAGLPKSTNEFRPKASLKVEIPGVPLGTTVVVPLSEMLPLLVAVPEEPTVMAAPSEVEEMVTVIVPLLVTVFALPVALMSEGSPPCAVKLMLPLLVIVLPLPLALTPAVENPLVVMLMIPGTSLITVLPGPAATASMLVVLMQPVLVKVVAGGTTCVVVWQADQAGALPHKHAASARAAVAVIRDNDARRPRTAL
ncbi:MAG TPA: hypothetical protein VGZ49_16030 [Xanthobacteraceae bacterium]|jgi:hypothetical protein|nr:hypothetical protein [Xanthobacteraceae bacterium]